MCFASIYVCLLHVCLLLLRSGEALDSLELELCMVVSHCVGVGNQTLVLCKNNKCSEPPSHYSSPACSF